MTKTNIPEPLGLVRGLRFAVQQLNGSNPYWAIKPTRQSTSTEGIERMPEHGSKPTFETFIRGLIRDIEPWGREREARLRRATILDRDNREISSGLAILEDDQPLGVFWPQAKPLDTNPEGAATLSTLIHKSAHVFSSRYRQFRGSWGG